jgi:MinD-like ATPase involved in chromosome partitioning or flagellar assembly
VEGTETGWSRPAEPAPRWRALLDRARHGRSAEEPAEEETEFPPAPPQQYAQPLPTRRPFNPVEVRAAFDPQAQYEQHPGAESQRPGQEARSGHEQYGADPRGADPRGAGARGAVSRGAFESRAGEQPGAFPARAGEQPGAFAPRAAEQPAAFPARAGEQPGAFASRAAEQRLEPRPVPQRPINPLDPRHQSRHGEGNGRRAAAAEPEQPRSFFNPPARSAAPATPASGTPAGPRDYPQVRASATAPVIPSPGYLPPAYPSPGTQPAPPSRPPAGQPSAAAPTSGARIEWRQTRPDDEHERAVGVMRRKLGRPRVLAFANPKGGVHKTTATVLAAATIGSVRGRGVLAWDDNELRGTLGLRAGSARHARTIKHLLADLPQIENLHGEGLLQELDAYLRHASDGSYDVLAGEENPRFAQRLDQATVRQVMDLLRRTHDVICVDTGNNVESVNWQTVMRQTDQLVITTVPREDAAFTADWMLDVLDDSGMGDLVANAVTLISCPSPGPLPLLNDFVKHFSTRTRAVAVVPYDPALEVGSSIEYAELQQETRQAWLKAAAVMIEPFAE